MFKVIETRSGGTAHVYAEGKTLKINLPGSMTYKDFAIDMLWIFREDGFAKGPLVQAKEIMHSIECDTNIMPIEFFDNVIIKGHSLGAGVGQIILYFYQKFYKDVEFEYKGEGGVCCLGFEHAFEINQNVNVKARWQVLRADPIPNISNWFYFYAGELELSGYPKFPFYFDFNLNNTHCEY